MFGPFPWPVVLEITFIALLLFVSLCTAGRPGRFLAGVILVTLIVSIGAGLNRDSQRPRPGEATQPAKL